MPKLKAKSGHLNGVQVQTINPTHQKLFFLGPKLNAAGNGLREANKAHEELNDKRAKLYEILQQPKEQQDQGELENLRKQTGPEEEKRVYLRIVIESLKQQYNVAYDKEEEKKEYDTKPEEEIWTDCLGEYFTDDDLYTIVLSMAQGKSFTREGAQDFLRDQIKQAQDFQEKQQLKKTAAVN